MSPGDLVRIWKPGYGSNGRLGMVISSASGQGRYVVAIPYPVNKLKVEDYDQRCLEKVSGDET